jgi:hypothetical protein
MEVRGTANDLDEALEPFANAALTLLPLFTLSANAATDEAEIEYGFDHTPGLTQRDYFQTYIPPEPEVVHVGRNMNLQATVALMSAIDKHPDSERLARGANQYREALLSWRLGRESLCLAHLWMAVEAITKVRLRAECIKQGLSDEADLAKKLGVDKKQLDGIIRKDLILRGDKDCYDKARQASDGFEHGFLEYGKIRELSTDVRHRMAAYVRAAILELCGLDAEVLKTLTTDPYDKPLGYWPLAKYLRGTLIGATDSFPAPGNAHPFIEWNPVVKSSKLNADGTLECEITENLKVKTPDGTGYQQKSLEVWEPG